PKSRSSTFFILLVYCAVHAICIYIYNDIKVSFDIDLAVLKNTASRNGARRRCNFKKLRQSSGSEVCTTLTTVCGRLTYQLRLNNSKSLDKTLRNPMTTPIDCLCQLEVRFLIG